MQNGPSRVACVHTHQWARPFRLMILSPENNDPAIWTLYHWSPVTLPKESQEACRRCESPLPSLVYKPETIRVEAIYLVPPGTAWEAYWLDYALPPAAQPFPLVADILNQLVAALFSLYPHEPFTGPCQSLSCA